MTADKSIPSIANVCPIGNAIVVQVLPPPEMKTAHGVVGISKPAVKASLVIAKVLALGPGARSLLQEKIDGESCANVDELLEDEMLAVVVERENVLTMEGLDGAIVRMHNVLATWDAELPKEPKR